MQLLFRCTNLTGMTAWKKARKLFVSHAFGVSIRRRWRPSTVSECGIRDGTLTHNQPQRNIIQTVNSTFERTCYGQCHKSDNTTSEDDEFSLKRNQRLMWVYYLFHGNYASHNGNDLITMHWRIALNRPRNLMRTVQKDAAFKYL